MKRKCSVNQINVIGVNAVKDNNFLNKNNYF